MLSDEVYDRLSEMLNSGAWPKDSRLPPEHDLARRLAVSRPVLRQALARLRAEGRIESRKGAGSYVRGTPPPAPISFGPLHSIPEVRAFLEFRCSLESEMAARAARCATPESIVGVRQAMARMDEAAAEGLPCLEEDIAFHMAVARASENRFFVTTLAAMTELMSFGIRLTRDLSGRPLQERLPALMAEHARILRGIESRDPEEARAAAHDHLTNGIRRLFGTF